MGKFFRIELITVHFKKKLKQFYLFKAKNSLDNLIFFRKYLRNILLVFIFIAFSVFSTKKTIISLNEENTWEKFLDS